MPNYVYNSVAIRKNNEEKAIALLEKGICQTLLPMPAHLSNTTYPGDEENWYEWAIENWGTKWGDIDLEYNSEQRVLSFTTAWSALGDKVVDLLLDYFGGNMIYWWEEEQGFGEEIKWKNHAVEMHRVWDEPVRSYYDDED